MVKVLLRKLSMSKMLNKSDMADHKEVDTYIASVGKVVEDGSTNVDGKRCMNMIENLMYFTTTRLKIVYAISLVFRFMSEATKRHMKVVKRILRYTKGTKEQGINYHKTNGVCLIVLRSLH